MHTRVRAFEEEVALKYELFNSLFLTLPFETIHRTGVLLPLLSTLCEEGYGEGHSPDWIINRFRAVHASGLSDAEFRDLLFRFVQYIERQVVLFDALEDAAFGLLHDDRGEGSLEHLFDGENEERRTALVRRLRSFSLRLVLTAHPTQFYPEDVLGIITDLAEAIEVSNVSEVKRLLMQLGRTPFMRREKPTPLDEAEALIWHLENVFYKAVPALLERVRRLAGEHPNDIASAGPVRIGFWPGGDRDGNPFVDAETTVGVAEKLRRAVLRQYLNDVRRLRRRLTFLGVAESMDAISNRLASSLAQAGGSTASDGGSESSDTGVEGYDLAEDLLTDLNMVRDMLIKRHDGLFLDALDSFILRVKTFGFAFAGIDIRQDSSVHDRVYDRLVEGADETIESILPVIRSAEPLDPASIEDEIERDVLESLRAMRSIQERGGEAASHRYIISHTRRPADVLKVMALARLSGWTDETTLDIVPLFETVADLKNASETMQALYETPIYRHHIARRGDCQTIMLGFSDGTKDGGFLAANWNIYRAKEALTAVSREYGITASFFDGRGGPPARGGGKTHAFYASLGSTIEVADIQLTIQGQTITSNFGTPDSASYNIEQLLTAGLAHRDTTENPADLSDSDRKILDELSSVSLKTYQALRDDVRFLPYLMRFGPLEYYGEANIGSRPSRRSSGGKLTLDDLRAIPFVGTWHQMKQNVPGFFGFGTALKRYEERGELDVVCGLYSRSPFFRALVENSMMALSKCFFPLTAHLSEDDEFGDIWRWIQTEYEDAVRLLKEVSGQKDLLASNEVGRRSIALREDIVRPLLTIQQYALERIHSERDTSIEESVDVYEKLVVRTMYGIINAGRNSA